jgi:hypothetical protein
MTLVSTCGTPAAASLPVEDRALVVQVLATSLAGTRAALGAAHSLCLDLNLDVQVVLFVPLVVPYPLPLEHPTISTTIMAERFRELAEDLLMNIVIRVCCCRPHSAALMPLLSRDAVILIGGRTRRWWPTSEQRVAASLAREGYRPLFVAAPAASRSEKRELSAYLRDWFRPALVTSGSPQCGIGLQQASRSHPRGSRSEPLRQEECR